MSLLITWIVFFAVSVLLFAVAPVVGRVKDEYGDPVFSKTGVSVLRFLGGAVAGILVVWVFTSVVVVIPPTHAAVMKNSYSGTARYTGSGWRAINPVVEEAVVYDMRLQEFQIGKPNVTAQDGTITEMLAVDAAADSPGLPLVYLVTTARVRYSRKDCPGSECDLVAIELQYGKQKWYDLVVDRMEMNTREVAGRNPYDYVGKKREDFADDVAGELEADMAGLAEFDYVGIPWYDFAPSTNEQLDQVAEREREIERVTQNITVAEQDQAKQKVEQDTAVIVAQKQAEARIAAAEGEKQASILRAEGEAEALRLVGNQLAANPLVIEYAKATGWDGKLPTMMGLSPVPFLDITAPTPELNLTTAP